MDTKSFIVNNCNDLQSQLESISILNGKNVLIQLFSDRPQEIISSLVEVLLARFSEATLIGMSSAQAIDKGEIEYRKTLIVISSFTETHLTSAVIPYQNDPGKASLRIVDELHVSAATKVAICFADRMEFSVRVNVDLFANVPESLSISGGASCVTENGQWVLYGREFYQHAYVAVGLHNEHLHVDIGSFTEWYPIGKTFLVTESKEDIVYTLDGQPIQDFYNRYLGNGHDVPFELLQNFPFIIGDETEQDVYTPIAVLENGGVSFEFPIPEGSYVRFCYGHPSLTLEQVCLRSQELYPKQPQAIFIYNCTSRLNFMEKNAELLPLQSVADSYGAYCMGEICRDESHQRILHHSLTFLALREGELSTEDRSPFVQRHPSYMGAVSPLFSLIRNSLLDLDEHHQSMAREIEQQAEMLARSYRIDSRTELPNRSALRHRLTYFKETEHLLTLKLSNFNQINEKYGYLVGDKLLQDLSEYFKSFFTDHTQAHFELFSIGIGEWALVFDGTLSASGIHVLFSSFADKLENVNFEPFGLPDVEFLSVSVNGGLVSRRDFVKAPIDGLLLKSIEARRYAYENNRRFCNANQLIQRDKKRLEQLSWLSFVSRAILNDNVVPYVQPIVRSCKHGIASYECLVRIQDDGDIILPGRFLPIIEGTHLYTRLSRQMISRTFELMNGRSDAFSINLAPQDFMSERTLEHLESAIKRIDNPSRVGIEVLETEQIKDYSHMIDVCNQLRNLGVSIIIDDFGSGYSNIDEIIKLEPQVIKLDGSLIRNIDRDIKQRQIAQQLIRLCHVLNAQTIAEFVHNAEICRLVENMGVDYLQGFYFGEPKPLI